MTGKETSQGCEGTCAMMDLGRGVYLRVENGMEQGMYVPAGGGRDGEDLFKTWSEVTHRHVFPTAHMCFRLQLKFHGLSLFKSSCVQFWPILGILQGYVK